jgi:subtilisin family serine protease
VRQLHLVREYAPGEATDVLPPTHIPQTAPGAVEPNLDLIQATDVWDKGYMGQGKIVANVDTGTDETHPDLANHIWFNVDEPINGVDDDGNGFVDDWIGWDFESNDNDPTPGSGHGTSTAGIVAGDGTNGRQTGVAPRASIMILKACGESVAMEAVQYAVDNGAHAITSSCSYKVPSQPAYAVWREISENTMLAGVPHANSIGNQGTELQTHPIPYNISAPGIAPPSWLHPAQQIVGGLGALVATGGVQMSLQQYVFSGHGPSAWEDIQENYPNQKPIPPELWDYPWANNTLQGLLKPEIVMPTNVWSTSNGGGYTVFGGTSAATPHTGGSLALLLSAAPDATPADISQALQTEVLDLGPPGKDNDYGSGLAQLFAATGTLVPAVTPVMEPYGQAIDPGGTFLFKIALVNNTAVEQKFFRRMDFHFNGKTVTVAGPGDFTLAAGAKKEIAWHFKPPATASKLSITAELVLEDLQGGLISSTSVEAHIR